MALNIANVRKDEIIKRSNFRCIHRHNGLDHHTCYDKERGIKERIGYLDIEGFGMGFSADTGCVMTYCILSEDGELISNFATPKELLSDQMDKRLMSDLCNDLRKFDKIITYYGKRYDVPYLRTRSLGYGLDFPKYKELNHIDVYDIIKHKFSFRRRSLEASCRYFNIPSKGHRFGFEMWRKAFQGRKDAMKNILLHNIEDVESLQALYHIVAPSARLVDSSI